MWSRWAKACCVEMTLKFVCKDSFKFYSQTQKQQYHWNAKRKTVLFFHLISNGYYNNKGKRWIHFCILLCKKSVGQKICVLINACSLSSSELMFALFYSVHKSVHYPVKSTSQEQDTWMCVHLTVMTPQGYFKGVSSQID